MYGAKDLVAAKDGLVFKIGRNASKANRIQIQLTPADDYTVTFWGGRGVNIKEITQHTGVYASDLHGVIEAVTGLVHKL